VGGYASSPRMWSATHAGLLNAPSRAMPRKRSTAGKRSSGVARMASCIAVSTIPGDTAYARRPASISSLATTRVIWSTAAFDPQYADQPA
jgi:hypothetical protein